MDTKIDYIKSIALGDHALAVNSMKTVHSNFFLTILSVEFYSIFSRLYPFYGIYNNDNLGCFTPYLKDGMLLLSLMISIFLLVHKILTITVFIIYKVFKKSSSSSLADLKMIRTAVNINSVY